MYILREQVIEQVFVGLRVGYSIAFTLTTRYSLITYLSINPYNGLISNCINMIPQRTVTIANLEGLQGTTTTNTKSVQCGVSVSTLTLLVVTNEHNLKDHF